MHPNRYDPSCIYFPMLLIYTEHLQSIIWSPLVSDQDPAMPAAIATVFPGTIHRLCKWHILNKFGPQLNELYARFAKREFKGKLNSVINHPLTVSEFEAAWRMLVIEEFGLGEHPTLKTLYDHRAEWVPAYFKGDYCGTMVSTQRGESVNQLVKSGHVDANTPLHVFAKQMMKVLHRRKMAEATATYAATVYTCPIQALCT